MGKITKILGALLVSFCTLCADTDDTIFQYASLSDTLVIVQQISIDGGSGFTHMLFKNGVNKTYSTRFLKIDEKSGQYRASSVNTTHEYKAKPREYEALREAAKEWLLKLTEENHPVQAKSAKVFFSQE